MSLCNANIIGGMDYLLQNSDLEAAIKSSDIVITGEGKIDNQTLQGKGPGKIALLARKYKKVIIGICGISELTSPYSIFDAIFTIVDKKTNIERAMIETHFLLEERSRKISHWIREANF